MLTLGIDTSNYATSLAVFDTCAGEVVCDKKKFLPVKKGQMGLRQSEALFHHIRELPNFLNQLNQQIPLSQIERVGVSARPRPVEGSYMPCFLAGVSAATAFALGKNIPVIETTHQQGHIAAALYAAAGKKLFSESALVFHISGGTTDLLLYKDMQHISLIGTSMDLYAGQAVDRIGVKLGFAFPAGTSVSGMAAQCREKVKPKCCVRGTQCSLSGIENQCESFLKQGKDNAYICKYCLLCIAETVVRMTKAALQEYPGLPVICAGGVMSSGIIAEYVRNRLPNVYFVPGKFSSDNAIGVSILAAEDWFLCER